MGLKRIDGWEARMYAAIEEARNVPYCLGVNDCLRVATKVVEALTGRDFWPGFAGKYSSRKEAVALFLRPGSWRDFATEPRPDLEREVMEALRVTRSPFAAAFSLLFETYPEPMVEARRGDICRYHDTVDDHLGVCIGAHVAVLGPAGLLFVQRSDCEYCWRIG